MARSTRRPASKTQTPRTDAATERPEDALDTTPHAPLDPRVTLKFVAALVLAGFAGFGAFALYHRPKDPHRIYATRAETQYARKVSSRLERCFGASDGTGIRRALDGVRRGTLPSPLDRCRGGTLSEVVTSPFDFAADIVNPPSNAERAQSATRDALSNLGGALRRYERVAGGLENGSIPEASRALVADALDDVATYTDQARGAVDDLRRISLEAASWY